MVKPSLEKFDHSAPLYPQADLRSPDDVMKLERMGSFFPTRLSFMRSTIRRLAEEKAKVERPVWQIDEQGFGRAVYSLQFGGYTYSLVAFSNRIDPEKRTDRVIAEVWDSAYVLFDGIPAKDDLDRLEKNAPLQEAGRFLASELVLSRANKSVRLFDHVVSQLSKGLQPDESMIAEIGYLMRTTAVYGNGKFGIADRFKFMKRPGMSGPFQAEMLTVWLIRNFTHDLVEHVAKCLSRETAVPLEPRLKRHLGIGNSTGLGMAPFLVSHPVLLNNWMMVRETALARVKAVKFLESDISARLIALSQRVRRHLDQWNVPDERQMKRILGLREEWEALSADFTEQSLSEPNSVEHILKASKAFSLEAQELVVAFLLEPFGELVDGLTECMAGDFNPPINPLMAIHELRSAIHDHYQWALALDLNDPDEAKQFWYVSEEKLEPRLGNRFEEEGAELELPHDIALRIQALVTDLEFTDEKSNLAEFMMRHPKHRYIIRRIQIVTQFPYAEIRDNLVGQNCLPIDMLRCKLSFFGASKFDPKSSRWTRITLYQGAPLADELSNPVLELDDWWLPVLESA